MSELYMMVTIIDRKMTKKFIHFYKEQGLEVSFVTLGMGTAASDILDYFGLDGAERSVLFHVVSGETWKLVKQELQKKMKIDIPGIGIAFTIPLSSMGGKKALNFLNNGMNFVKGEESVLKDTNYELIIAIANQGYTEMVMDAAREVNAAGGTTIHARGTGTEKAEKFLGVTLAEEKEMVFIVAKSRLKSEIMRAIIDKAGLSTKAGAVVFSLPVTETAGMRLMEEAVTVPQG